MGRRSCEALDVGDAGPAQATDPCERDGDAGPCGHDHLRAERSSERHASGRLRRKFPMLRLVGPWAKYTRSLAEQRAGVALVERHPGASRPAQAPPRATSCRRCPPVEQTSNTSTLEPRSSVGGTGWWLSCMASGDASRRPEASTSCGSGCPDGCYSERLHRTSGQLASRRSRVPSLMLTADGRNWSIGWRSTAPGRAVAGHIEKASARNTAEQSSWPFRVAHQRRRLSTVADPEGFDVAGFSSARRIPRLLVALALPSTIAVSAASGAGAAIIGTGGNDTLVGTEGADAMDGRGGNDISTAAAETTGSTAVRVPTRSLPELATTPCTPATRRSTRSAAAPETTMR